MLVVLTQLAVFRVSAHQLERKLAKGAHRSVVTMNYPAAVELIAYLNGEPASKQLLYDAVHRLYPIDGSLEAMEVIEELPDDIGFSFACSDGLLLCDYSARTLGKHFSNIEAFSSTFPLQPMPMPQYSMEEVDEAIQGVMIPSIWGMEEVRQLSDTRGILDLLGPSSDLYYLLFDLEGIHSTFFSSLHLTEREKGRLREVHDVQTRIAHGRLEGTDPFNGAFYYSVSLPNPSPFCAFHSFTSYLAEVGQVERARSLFPDNPSYLAVNWILHNGVIDPDLLSADFNDDSGVLDDDTARSLHHYLIQAIANQPMTYGEIVRVLTMLNVRSPLLKNEEMEVYPPYQITTPFFITQDVARIVATLLARHRQGTKGTYMRILEAYTTGE